MTTRFIASLSAITFKMSSSKSTLSSRFFSSILLHKPIIQILVSSFKSNSDTSSLYSLDDIFDISSISLTIFVRRFDSSSTILRYSFSFSGGIVPSKIPSINPEILVIGVLSSCDTSLINSLLVSSNASMESAIKLKLDASCPISSALVTSTRLSNLPDAIPLAALLISSIGFEIFFDCIYTRTNAANTENSDVIITIINNSSVVFLISKIPVT